MVTRYDATMDGKALSAISDKILVMDIAESAPSIDTHTASRPSGAGSFVLGSRRESLAVTISFAVRAYSTEERKRILSDVAAWCEGEYLSVSDRPGQRLRVVCDTPPSILSAMRWTETISVMFVAYVSPYWEAQEPLSASVEGETGSVSLTPSGNAQDCVLEADITNTGTGTLGTVMMTVWGKTMRFDGLGIAPGGVLSMRLKDGILTYPSACLTEESQDEIRLQQKITNVITYAADQPVSAVFYAREVYL